MCHISGIAVTELKHTSRNVQNLISCKVKCPYSPPNQFSSVVKCSAQTDMLKSAGALPADYEKSSVCTNLHRRERQSTWSQLTNGIELFLFLNLTNTPQQSYQKEHMKCSWKSGLPLWWLSPPRRWQHWIDMYCINVTFQCRTATEPVSQKHAVWMFCVRSWWGWT